MRYYPVYQFIEEKINEDVHKTLVKSGVIEKNGFIIPVLMVPKKDKQGMIKHIDFV